MLGNIVATPSGIQDCLLKVNPKNIAVAFIGAGWRSYIANPNTISSIVLSPTLGSNPSAIEELAKIITWERVHFLDNLHAKIYIGANSALMGSCNLSDNGMGEGGLEEVAILLQDPHQIETLTKEVEGYVEKAKLAYPTTRSKQDRVRELVEQRKEMPRYCPPGEYGKSPPDIRNYSYSSSHRIHVVPFGPGKIVKNEKIIRGILEVPSSIKINDLFYDEMDFRNEDNIEVGDWILCWGWSSKNNLPLESGKVAWMYVDAVVKNGCVDDQYMKLAGQKVKSIPCPPFNLTPNTKKIIREVLALQSFKLLRPNDNLEAWNCNHADELLPAFIKEVIKQTQA